MPGIREEKIFCISTYLEIKPYKTVQAKFCRKFNFNNYHQKSQIYRWVHTFQATGSVNNLNKKAKMPWSGRKLNSRCSHYVDAVRDSVGRSPLKFPRRRSPKLGLLLASLQRILKKDLPLYPYRIQIKHKLTPAEMGNISVINPYRINGLYLF